MIIWNIYRKVYHRKLDTVRVKEWDIYGSKRIGIIDTSLIVYAPPTALSYTITSAPPDTLITYDTTSIPDSTYAFVDSSSVTDTTVSSRIIATTASSIILPLSFDSSTTQYYEGQKQYELTNHLGNVLVTVSDKKLAVDTTTILNVAQYYMPEIINSEDFYPFGFEEPGRTYRILRDSLYRYGFNTQEKDNEIYGTGNAYTADFWEYDSRIVKRWNRDPVNKEWESPYAVFANNPIWFTDFNGADTGVKYGGAESANDVFSNIQNPKQGDKYTVYAGLTAEADGASIYEDVQTKVYHAGNAYGEAGWYSEDDYEYINRDWANGQVLPAQGFWSGLWSGQRTWSDGYAVDDNGYLTGQKLSIGVIDCPVGPGELEQLGREGEYLIYNGLKTTASGEELPYIGKALGVLENRYTASEMAEGGYRVFAGLEKIPNNGIALGVEQLVMELNGWEGKAANAVKPVLSNINNATIKDIYIKAGKAWLEKNVPDWQKLYKLKK